MEEIRTIQRDKAQKKYRKSRLHQGFVRYEIQVKAEAKAKFEELVQAAADEYDAPWDKRQRMSMARAQVFEEMTQGALHEFTALKTQISALQDEVQALAPQFFVTESTNTPLPSAIQSLPDDPKHLKTILAKIYSEGQQAIRQLNEYKRRSEQYLKLYEAMSDQADALQAKLDERG